MPALGLLSGMHSVTDAPPVPDTYWGTVRKLATLAPGVSVFHVAFHDNTPHRLHHHPRHAETVLVVNLIAIVPAGEESASTRRYRKRGE